MTQHTLNKVTAFELLEAYKVRVQFDDATEQEIDFEPVLKGDLYAPLRDKEVFNRVRIDPEVHTLVWPNGADFDPQTLHDWPTLGKALIKLAATWNETATTN